MMQADRSNITRARALYELALEADPQHLQSLLGLGSLEARAGSVDRGLRLLQEGLRLQPDNKQFRHMVAQWQRKHGEREVSCGSARSSPPNAAASPAPAAGCRGICWSMSNLTYCGSRQI